MGAKIYTLTLIRGLFKICFRDLFKVFMLPDLQNQIKFKFDKLNGSWIRRNSAYETELCRALGMAEEKGRYWDARWQAYLLEFKKGEVYGLIWSDIVKCCFK